MATEVYTASKADMTLVADAIREKSGVSGAMTWPDGFAEKVRGIKGGFPNGEIWEKAQGVTGEMEAVCKIKGTWVAVGRSGIYSSTDGKNWALREAGAKTGAYSSDGKVVAVDRYSYVSENGETWQKGDALPGAGAAEGVYGDDGVWLSMSLVSRLGTSKDGLTWSDKSGIVGPIGAHRFHNRLIVGTYKNGVYYSDNNGKTWVKSNLATGRYDAAFSGEGICILLGFEGGGEPGGIFYSADGGTWERSDAPTGNYVSGAYGKGTYVVATSKGIVESKDGKTWVQTDAPKTFFHVVTYGNSRWVAGGNNGDLYYSDNGANWKKCHWASKERTTGIRYADGLWVASTIDGLYYSAGWEPKK